jgi:hypothetical protein
MLYNGTASDWNLTQWCAELHSKGSKGKVFLYHDLSLLEETKCAIDFEANNHNENSIPAQLADTWILIMEHSCRIP